MMSLDGTAAGRYAARQGLDEEIGSERRSVIR
jgi:hypothetical protein